MDTEYTVDNTYDCIAYQLTEERTMKAIVDKSNSKALKMANGSHLTLLLFRQMNAVTHLEYREVPFPWYV